MNTHDSSTDDKSSSTPPWRIVALREMTVRISDKAFMVGTGITIALIAALIGLQIFMAQRTHEVDLVVSTPAALSTANAMSAKASAFDENLRLKVTSVTDEAAARTAVESKKADAWLAQRDARWQITTRTDPDEQVQRLAEEVLRAQALSSALAGTGTGTTAEQITAQSQVTSALLKGDASKSQLAQVMGAAFGVLFLLASMSLGMALAGSVVEEKQSRIVEIIATAVPLRQLLAGKVIGNTVLALGQQALYLSIGLIGLTFTQYSELTTALTGPVLWFIVFFLAGFVMLACLWAVAGSLASRTEDLQATTGPLTLVTMAVYMSAFALQGQGRVIGSYIPPLSAVLMPARVLEGTATWWQAMISLAILALCSVVTVRVGARLYQRSLLQTGGRVSLRQVWRATD